MLLFHKCQPKTLLVWAVVFISLLPALLLLAGGGEPSDEWQAYGRQAMDHDTAIYGHGSIPEIFQKRFLDWLSGLFNQVLFYRRKNGVYQLHSAIGDLYLDFLQLRTGTLR